MSKKQNYLSKDTKKTIIDLASQLHTAIILAHNEITTNLPDVSIFPEYKEARAKELAAQVRLAETMLAVAKVEMETKKFPLRYESPKHPSVIAQAKADMEHGRAINIIWEVENRLQSKKKKQYELQKALTDHLRDLEQLIRRVK